MKKFILALLPFLFFLYSLLPVFPPAFFAQAETLATPSAGGYACILENDVYFYTSQNDKRGLFLLPKTYFVRVLEVQDDFCKVEYLYDDPYVKKLVGYTRTEQLAFVDYVPKRPYLYRLFDVRYSLDDALAGDEFLNQITITCAYYGDYIVGSETYCYVLRGDAFGYIPKPENFTYEENPEYAENLEPVTPDPNPNTGGDANSQSNPAQIAILVALCLLVPVLAALILKPPRRPPYEQDE